MLCVRAAHKLNGEDVLEILYPLILKHGKPDYIRSDNGPEFIANSLQEWLRRVGVKPIQIYPGSPWENVYNKRFNGTLRAELLNSEWFQTKPSNRHRPLSIYGLNSTTTSGPIRHSICDQRYPKPYNKMVYENWAG